MIAHPRPPRLSSGAHTAVLCLIAVLGIQMGCATRKAQWDTSHDKNPTTVGPLTDTNWPFWPYDMRIHPLTQFMNDRQTDKLMIEARLEFLDPYGHTCKAFGQIEIALHDADTDQFNANPVGIWPEDLTDLELNEIYFDDVTGTYLLRLEISEEMEVPQQALLRAAYLSADGRRLQAEYVIRN